MGDSATMNTGKPKLSKLYRRTRALTLCLLCALVLTVPMTAFATPVGNTGSGNSGVTPGGGGGGGGGGGEGEGEAPPPGDYVPELPKELLVNPKVTALHSLNALLANDSDSSSLGVYFIPSLEDFPTKLKDTAAYVVDELNVVHNFAVVYDGYFDTEVTYVAAANDDADTGPVGRLQTSKKVYSSVDNTKTLNLLGYDLLLANEQVQITTSGTEVSAEYMPTLVGNSPLDAQTVIMDIYKALDEAEWDIRFVYVKDDELALDTSPIQSEISVAISDEIEEGIDTSEGATYVWATRTNPLLYWNKVKRDAVFDGGAHTVTNTNAASYVGSDVSVSFSKAQSDSVTFGEFCCIVRAMMDLYGEPVMTTQEQLIMIQTYGLSLPDCSNEEVYQSVSYLAAKGIINPQDCDLNKYVTFGDIEPILIRIADEDARLTFKSSSYNENSTLFQMGYVSASTSLSEGLIEEVDRVNSDATTRYNDFFVECDDDLTNFIITTRDGEQIFAADNLLCNGYASASSDVWYVKEPPPEDVYPFEFKGIEDNFYHFAISAEESSITISYDRDVDNSEYTLNMDSYTLPNAEGGVYLVENGNFVHYSFNDAVGKLYYTTIDGELVEKALPDYSLVYIDNERRNDPTINEMADFGFMSTYNWVYMTIDDTAYGNLGDWTYGGVSLGDLNKLSSGDVGQLIDSAGNRIYVKYVDTTVGTLKRHTFIFQVNCSLTTFKRNLSASNGSITGYGSNNAYFRPDDNSVLVSCDYLKTKGLISAVQKLTEGEGYVLTLSGVQNTNVVLRQDLGIILVGDTLYKVSNELLYYTAAEVLYINYRACIGWTTDYLVLNNNGDLQLTKGTSSRSAVGRTTLSLTTYYPTSNVSMPGVTYNGKKRVPLHGLNPLGNYLLVVDPVNNNDCLFMWKRKEYALPSSSSVQSYGDDSAARQKFTDMTGISLSSSDDYVLMVTVLYHKDTVTIAGDFTWYAYSCKGESGALTSSVTGWFYTPVSYSSFDEAATEYLETESASMLPIALVSGRLINLNINMCSVDPVSDVLPYGQMPYKYQSAISLGRGAVPRVNAMYKIEKANTYKITSATYTSLADSVIHPAPVGMFNSLYGLPKVSIGQASGTSKTIYYGSQKLKVKNISGKSVLVLGPNYILVSDDLGESVQAMSLGSGTSGIYSYSTDSLGVNSITEQALDNVANVVTDANALVDWDAFTFRRLVSKLDQWSSIALIFALNVIPRLGMCLFFVLIILTCIKDWRPWVRFCNNHFDIYSFLTFGKQNVNTIETKKVVFNSMLALAVFFMVCDGLLFNFILWISKFILIAIQR